MRYVVLGSDGVPYEKFADGTSKDLSDEIPFDLPQGWAWARLIDISDSLILNDGDWIVSSDMSENGNIKLLQLGSVGNGVYENKRFKYITDEKFDELGCSEIHPGYLLVNRMIGDSMLACILPEIDGRIITAVDICWISPSARYDVRFLLYLVLSPYFQKKAKALGAGEGRVRISKGNLIRITFPLPPLAEQKRIVAKVEELFAYADQIGSASEEITKTAQRLDKKILDLAIRGKLVPQDPNDEPASELVKRIEEQRQAKTGGKKSRIATSHKPTYEIEPPFDIPESWQWVRLGSISNYGECQTIDANKIPSKTWSLDLEEIEKGSGRLLVRRLAGEKASTSSKHKFCKGMILYSKLRTYLNKVLIADMDGVCTSEIIPITLLGDILPEYIRTVLMSPYFLAYTASKDYGVKMPRIGTGDARAALIPLPPLAEQKRIVKKIDELKKMTQALVAL